jgi:hypothetical protein
MTLVPNQTPGIREYDNFVLGNFPIKTETATILSGQVLLKGTALGKITSGGKLRGLDSDLDTGAENAYAILLEDVDATDGDVFTKVALSGDFNEDEIIFVNSADDADTYRDEFRDKSIFLQKTVRDNS